VNVGILYLFPEENRADFLFPSKLVRLKELFGDVNLNTIRDFLQNIQRVTQKINFGIANVWIVNKFL